MSISCINTNFDALFARQNIQKLELSMGRSMQRIASGMRVNTAADDPYAVSAIATATAQMNGNRVAQQNIQDGLALLQWADGVASQYADSLQQLRDLALTRANDATLSTTQVTALDTEFGAIHGDYDDAKYSTDLTWNGKVIFDSAFTGTFQVGPGGNENFTVALTTQQFGNTAQAIGTTIATVANATGEIANIDTALDNVNSVRALIGQGMRRLENSLKEQLSMEVNNASTVSSMGDADLASEIGNLARDQILSQSATAIMAQANNSSQLLLQLLG
jgi:flagellin